MKQRNLIKGIIYTLISLLFVSFQPIITNARPEELDAFLFAATIPALSRSYFFYRW
ncbi:MAG: hypothetical protein R6U96_14385 [Promethearchaeia archaeon]